MPAIRKNTAALALAVLFFLSASAGLAAPGDPGCHLDIDGSGVVDQDDLTQCTTLLQIFPPIYNPACDANGDGFFTVLDLTIFLDFIGTDCTAVVPFGSDASRILLVMGLLLASAIALRMVTPAHQ